MRDAQMGVEEDRHRLALAAATQAIETTGNAWRTAIEKLQAGRLSLGELENQVAALLSRSAALDEERSANEALAAAAKVELGKSDERLANLRLRAQQLERDQLERQRTVEEVQSEIAQCVTRHAQAERVVLAAESELAGLYLAKERSLEQTSRLVAERESRRSRRAAQLAAAQALRATAEKLAEQMHAHELATHDVRHARSTTADRLFEDYGTDLAALPTLGEAPQPLRARKSTWRSPSCAARSPTSET